MQIVGARTKAYCTCNKRVVGWVVGAGVLNKKQLEGKSQAWVDDRQLSSFLHIMLLMRLTVMLLAMQEHSSMLLERGVG
jgi:hypothetical protein